MTHQVNMDRRATGAAVVVGIPVSITAGWARGLAADNVDHGWAIVLMGLFGCCLVAMMVNLVWWVHCGRHFAVGGYRGHGWPPIPEPIPATPEPPPPPPWRKA